MNPADEMAAKRHAAIDDNLGKQLSAVLESLERPSPQREPVEEDEPVERDDLRPGFTSYLHREASERKAIHDRLVVIENEMKRRGRFARYLVAILIGVAGTLAWQSYSDAAKQVIATSAPELGWSPEAKQMIASWVRQLGWTKPPAASEKQAAPVAETAIETVAPKAPAAPSLDPEQVQRMARDLATMRQTVDQLAAGLDEVNREIGKLEVADEEILKKITPAPPPPRPIAAPARKPTPAPPSSSRPIPPPHP
jgi:hypothetical protein